MVNAPLPSPRKEQGGGGGTAEGEIDVDAIVIGASGEGKGDVVGRWIERQASAEGELSGEVAEEDLENRPRFAGGWRIGDIDDIGDAVVVDIGGGMRCGVKGCGGLRLRRLEGAVSVAGIGNQLEAEAGAVGVRSSEQIRLTVSVEVAGAE